MKQQQQPQSVDAPWLTPQQVAAELQVHYPSILHGGLRQALPWVRLGPTPRAQLRLHRDALARFLRAHTERPAA